MNYPKDLKFNSTAKKKYHSLSRKLCLWIVALTVTIIQLGISQKFLAQDFWEEIMNTTIKPQSILILLLMLMPVFIYTQTQATTDSLYRKLNEELVLSKSNTSDIVWERILIPEGKELRSFEVTLDNDLYIGFDYGGVYKYNYGEWELIGLDNQSVAEFEVNSENNLLIASSDLYVWDGVSLQFMAYGYKNPLKNIYGDLFAAAGSRVLRSTDNGQNWDTVFNVGGAEFINDFRGTTPDSIFMGTTNWVGYDGGIYLSIDGGNNWNHFGLSQHFIACLAVDNYNQVYAGNKGHFETGQGGLYRYNYGTEIWDTLHYFPYITSIVFNTENYIYTSFITSGADDWGGVLHSEDNGETWILDTTGIGNTMVNELQIDINGFLYALTGYTTKKLYRTTLPVNILENQQSNTQTLKCFPNPAKNYISVAFKPNHKNSAQMSLVVSNSIGQTLFKRKLKITEMEKGNILLDISNLKAGFYVIRITSNNFYAVNKFSKQ